MNSHNTPTNQELLTAVNNLIQDAENELAFYAQDLVRMNSLQDSLQNMRPSQTAEVSNPNVLTTTQPEINNAARATAEIPFQPMFYPPTVLKNMLDGYKHEILALQQDMKKMKPITDARLLDLQNKFVKQIVSTSSKSISECSDTANKLFSLQLQFNLIVCVSNHVSQDYIDNLVSLPIMQSYLFYSHRSDINELPIVTTSKGETIFSLMVSNRYYINNIGDSLLQKLNTPAGLRKLLAHQSSTKSSILTSATYGGSPFSIEQIFKFVTLATADLSLTDKVTFMKEKLLLLEALKISIFRKAVRVFITLLQSVYDVDNRVVHPLLETFFSSRYYCHAKESAQRAKLVADIPMLYANLSEQKYAGLRDIMANVLNVPSSISAVRLPSPPTSAAASAATAVAVAQVPYQFYTEFTSSNSQNFYANSFDRITTMLEQIQMGFEKRAMQEEKINIEDIMVQFQKLQNNNDCFVFLTSLFSVYFKLYIMHQDLASKLFSEVVDDLAILLKVVTNSIKFMNDEIFPLLEKDKNTLLKLKENIKSQLQLVESYQIEEMRGIVFNLLKKVITLLTTTSTVVTEPDSNTQTPGNQDKQIRKEKRKRAIEAERLDEAERLTTALSKAVEGLSSPRSGLFSILKGQNGNSQSVERPKKQVKFSF